MYWTVLIIPYLLSPVLLTAMYWTVLIIPYLLSPVLLTAFVLGSAYHTLPA